MVFSDNMPRSGIAESYGSSMFSFLEEPPLSILHCGGTSTVTVPIYIPTNNVGKGSLFSTSSPAFIVWRFFDDGHPHWCEVIPHCNSDLYFCDN